MNPLVAESAQTVQLSGLTGPDGATRMFITTGFAQLQSDGELDLRPTWCMRSRASPSRDGARPREGLKLGRKSAEAARLVTLELFRQLEDV